MIYGLLMIIIIETSALATIVVTMGMDNNFGIKDEDTDREKERFFGQWEERFGNNTYWFKPDGTVEINETASRFGMGVYTDGYIIWNGTWEIREVSGIGEESNYVLVINNLTEVYSSTAGYADGKIEEGDNLKIIYEFREKMYGDALYLYFDAFSPTRFNKME